MPEEPKTEQPSTTQAQEKSSSAGSEVEQAKSTAWLSYLGILWLVPLLTMKDNSFAKWHVKQGIAMDIVSVGLWILFAVLIWTIVLPVIFGLALGVLLVFRVIGIVKALQGQTWKCPLGVSNLASVFKF